MSKTQLTKFLKELSKAELREQIVDLYHRYKNVKEYYDFSFNPNEDKRIEAAKLKITKEYFPESRRKAKKRRSVAQKIIVHLQKLEVNPEQLADLMLYNIEIAQNYTAENEIKQEAFYKSMLTSFRNALVYLDKQFLLQDFEARIGQIQKTASSQNWPNAEGFIRSLSERIRN
ncbi:MAG: hypothetical protein JKY48_11585 [Flavobacteriales bacterium]|nr:hypothetical protein [Flavobacteriales bacterium]